MPTPIRSLRLSDESMAFLLEMAEAHGSMDDGVLAMKELVDQQGTRPNAPNPEQKEEPPPKKAETAAQRKQRERKEHAEALAEADVVAKAAGRNDIDYDLEQTPHRNVLQPVGHPVGQANGPHYQVQNRRVKPLTRPHGETAAKRRREQ